MTEQAALYTRVSSPGQATADAASLQVQEQIARGLAEQDGREVVEHYCDAGKSATSDDLTGRPAMERLLADAAAGRFSYLYCYHEDRLARNSEVAAVIAGKLRRAGVTILTERGPVDLDTFGGKLLYLVTSLLAEEEPRRIRERTDNAKRDYALRGMIVDRQEPLGYRWQAGDLRHGRPNVLVPVESELEAVRDLFAFADETRWPVRRLAAELNRRAVPYPRGGRKWYPSDVAEILRDERYCGKWIAWRNDVSKSAKENARRKGRALKPETHMAFPEYCPPPAIAADVWNRVQRDRAHHRSRTRRPMKHHFLLNGLLVCPLCGVAFVGHVIAENADESAALRYYHSTPRKRDPKHPDKPHNEDCPCRNRYVPAEPLEAEAWGVVLELRDDPSMARRYLAASRTEEGPKDAEEEGRLTRALEGCDRALETLLGKLAKEVISDADFALARQAIDRDREEWQARLAELHAKQAAAGRAERAVELVTGKIGAFGDRLDTLTTEERRCLLRDLDLRMELRCDDWRAPSRKRRYDVTTRWAGEALLAEDAATHYVGSLNALAM